METRAKIILTRGAELLNRLRPYRVLVDGVEVGMISNDSVEEYFVGPGDHVVECRISFYGSEPFRFKVGENENIYLRVKTGMRFYFPLIATMIAGILINLLYAGRPDQKPLWASVLQLILILPTLIYLLYHLTFARKRYLLLEEDKENIFS